ncbi:MAG: PAS domain S-box protein [Desulfohalobiaceae bacterium]
MAQNSHSAQDAGYSALSSEHSLFTNAPLGIIITTPEGRLLSVNPAMSRMFGYDSPEKLIESVDGITTQLYADPSDTEELMRLLRENDEVLNYEFRGVHRDGSMIWISINVTTVRDNNGEIIHFQNFITDITERKQVEEELREREAWLDLFFSQALSGTFFVMLDEPLEWNNAADKERLLDYAMTHLRTTRVNQAMLDQYGATEEDFIGLTPKDLFAHDLEQFRFTHRRLFDKGHLRFETREQRLDGRPIIIEGDSICMYDDHGRITGFFGVQSEITQRKQTEEALRESEERFKTVLENLPGGIFAHDLDGRILMVNAQAGKNTGYSREELLRMTVWDIDPYAAPRVDQTALPVHGPRLGERGNSGYPDTIPRG